MSNKAQRALNHAIMLTKREMQSVAAERVTEIAKEFTEGFQFLSNCVLLISKTAERPKKTSGIARMKRSE